MHYIFFIPLCSIRHRAKIQTLSWNWHLRQLKRKYPGLSQLPPDYFLSLSVAVMLENFVSTLLDSPTAHWNSFLILWFINFVFGDSWYHSCPFIQAGTLVLTSLSLEIWAVNTRPGVNRSEHPHFLCVSGDKCLTAENICLLVLGLSPVFTVPVYSFSITSGNWSLAPGFPMKTCLKSLLCFDVWTYATVLGNIPSLHFSGWHLDWRAHIPVKSGSFPLTWETMAILQEYMIATLLGASQKDKREFLISLSRAL